MNQPTPREIKVALRDWVPANLLIFRPGWKDRGRPWTYGIRGLMVHHWAGTGDGGQEWMEQRSSQYPYCNNTIRRDGRVMIVSALSAWHSGLGGPWGRAGVPKVVAHLMVWGTEMEGPLPVNMKKFEDTGGRVRVDDMTDEQWTQLANVTCAIREVAGPEAFPNFSRQIRHSDWTDGTAGVAAYTLPTVGRKNDVWRDIKPIRQASKRAWGAKHA
ncbi:MAG: hypothetical protein ABFD94_16490 [Armatimonadia bacterium]